MLVRVCSYIRLLFRYKLKATLKLLLLFAVNANQERFDLILISKKVVQDDAKLHSKQVVSMRFKLPNQHNSGRVELIESTFLRRYNYHIWRYYSNIDKFYHIYFVSIFFLFKKHLISSLRSLPMGSTKKVFCSVLSIISLRNEFEFSSTFVYSVYSVSAYSVYL